MFFLPLFDDNPTTSRPYISWTIIAVCILVYLYQAGLSQRDDYLFILHYGVIPARFFSQFEKRIFQFVLGCIDADFCDRIPCWKALHEIYKFHILRVTLISKFSHISVKIFSKKISTIVK